MEQVRRWSRAKRAGGRITILHATGKIVGVDYLEPRDGKLIAMASDGKEYELVMRDD